MTIPLILQIQEAALDGKLSVTDALRKAKIACAKLGLTEFGSWVDRELNGYTEMNDLPNYRKLSGIPEGYNPYWGWHPVQFASSAQKAGWSQAPVGMAISAIEDSTRMANAEGGFSFPYPPEVEQDLRDNVSGSGNQFRIRLDVAQCGNIVHAVRNVLLDWTMKMEAQGITGRGLVFTAEELEKSAAPTMAVINHFHIGQVATFVQQADNSIVNGLIDNPTELPKETLKLVKQLAALLGAANLPAGVQKDVNAALGELKEAAEATHPETGRLKRGLQALKRVLAPAGETLVKLAVDAAVNKMLGPGGSV